MSETRDKELLVLVNETSEEKEIPLKSALVTAPPPAGAVGAARDRTTPTDLLKRITGGAADRAFAARGGQPQEEERQALENLTIPPGGGLKITRAVLDLYDYRSLEEAKEISLVPAVGAEPVSGTRIVVNKTARHIAIKSRPNEAPGELVITPFGKRRVSLSTLKQLDFDSWRQLNLIRVANPKPPDKGRLEWWFAPFATAIYGWIAILVLDSALPETFNLFGIGGDQISIWWLWPIAIVLVAIVAFLFGSRRGATFRGVTVQSVNLMLLLGLGPLGLPILVALFFGGVLESFQMATLPTIPVGLAEGAQAVAEGAQTAGLAEGAQQTNLSVGLLGRGLQTMFIILLSALPGLLYFQYERRHVSSVRTRFIRDIMMVNPWVQTVDDAEVTYGKMVDEVSGAIGGNNRQFAVLSTGRPILMSTLLITVGWIVALWPVGSLASVTDIHALLIPHQSPVVFAFMGAYFFAINLVFRRYARGDLTPKAYSHVIVRILSSVIIVWVVSVAFSATDLGSGTVLLVTAFGIGIVPETGVTLLKDVMRKFPTGRMFPSVDVAHPITDLEGISLYDQARLLEEGVESVENLAHNNLIELMLRSGIPTPRLVDLVDQAILYLHVSGVIENREGGDDRARTGMDRLRESGIRTATDLLRVVQLAEERVAATARLKADDRRRTEVEENLDKLFMLLNKAGEDGPNRMRLVLDALADDEWLEYVKNWRSLCRAGDIVSEPEHFYRTASRSPAAAAST